MCLAPGVCMCGQEPCHCLEKQPRLSGTFAVHVQATCMQVPASPAASGGPQQTEANRTSVQTSHGTIGHYLSS